MSRVEKTKWRPSNKIRWISDDEGDIGISFFDILVLVKYKESIIVQWFRRYSSATKYQGGLERSLNRAEEKEAVCDCGANADNRWPHHDQCSIYTQPPAVVK